MFEISEQTKATAIEEIRKILKADGVSDIHLTDSVIGEAFDAAVSVVKAQFGF